ncbi:MAG TPA: type I methionyl aminopeptidase [Bacilli bacterium]|nr:type I methionyl aminopeptidase [Bacilli bacterium]
MISIKNKTDIEKMRISGKINYQTHKYLESNIKPGITTKYLNDIADKFIRSKGGIPSFLNYEGYPASICVSINEEVVHGIPSSRKLRNGDLVKLDIGVIYDGMHSDSAATYKVGTVSSEKEKLMLYTKEALYEGLKEVKAGVRLGNISSAIERSAKKHRLGVVQELVGHGVGYNLHEDPDIPNYGKANIGPILKEGMTLAIEPMLNLGTRKIFIKEDDWTIITQDAKPSAHFEHTVLVTKDGCEILTKE